MELNPVHLSSNKPRLSLSLSTVVSLILPVDIPQESSAGDISHLVEAGKLWISRAGTCQLGVSVAVAGRPIALGDAASPKAESVLEALTSCPVRSRLSVYHLAKRL